MVSSGLSGLAAVMVEMTVPGQRRMALAPASCPITDQSETHKTSTKSIATLSSGEVVKETKFVDSKKPQAKYDSFDSKKTLNKSMAGQPVRENNVLKNKDYRLNSSPNLSLIDDRRGSDVARNRLAPRHAILSVEPDGSIDGTHLFSTYDKASHPSSDQESIVSEDGMIGVQTNKTRRKKREKSNSNLSKSERNISTSGRTGSPFLKKLVGLGRSRSNKGLHRTDSSDSDKLIQTVNSAVLSTENDLPRQDSSINILITGADSENDPSDNQGGENKLLSNGRRNFGRKPERSISMLQTPSHDYF